MAPTGDGGPLRAQLAVLRRLGFDDLEHDSHVPFMAHLAGTRRLLSRWGCRDELATAGLFHSVYGTEFFTPDATPSRDEIRQVIGDDAERVAWLWCVIRRDELDPVAATAPNRNTGELLELSPGDVADIATLWCADTCEQIDRMTPDEHGFALHLHRVIAFADRSARAASEPILARVGS